MICPRCEEKFFSRNYSTLALHKTVNCPQCKHRFPAPLRADIRRILRDTLKDSLFDDDVYKKGTLIERVQWMISKLGGGNGHRDD